MTNLHKRKSKKNTGGDRLPLNRPMNEESIKRTKDIKVVKKDDIEVDPTQLTRHLGRKFVAVGMINTSTIKVETKSSSKESKVVMTAMTTSDTVETIATVLRINENKNMTKNTRKEIIETEGIDQEDNAIRQVNQSEVAMVEVTAVAFDYQLTYI